MAEMLSLNQRDFDQDPNIGWRQLYQQPGCRTAAANLIRAYINANGEEGIMMTFHEGQMRAMGGDTQPAIALLERTYTPANKPDRYGWNYYVDATIAFLRRDKARLRNARAQLTAVPRPENFDPVDSFGKPIEIRWPPNLNVVDGLLKCFEHSYDYAVHNCSSSFKEKKAD
ncbi:MAG: hypothetical protein AAF358_11375 [Pseudomonadota bacterium]